MMVTMLMLVALVQWALWIGSVVVIFAWKENRETVWIAAAVFTLINLLVLAPFGKRSAKRKMAEMMRD